MRHFQKLGASINRASDRAHDFQKVLRKSLVLIIILTTPIASCFVFYSTELIGCGEFYGSWSVGADISGVVDFVTHLCNAGV